MASVLAASVAGMALTPLAELYMRRDSRPKRAGAKRELFETVPERAPGTVPGGRPTREVAATTIPDSWEGPAIYAGVYYTVDENAENYGIYAIDAASGRTLPVVIEGHPIPNGGGFYDNGIYRFVQYFGDDKTPFYCEYDMANWQLLRKEALPDCTNVSIDEAYDPETGFVYGCLLDAKGQTFHFGYVDHDTHEAVKISDLDVLMYGIFATPEGSIYGIGSDGNLHMFDKETGRHTRVGSLGVQPMYNQTAIYDMQTGTAYWLGCNKAGASGIYTINLETGKARLIKSFSSRDGMVGSVIAQNPWRDGAPGRASGLSANFDKSSLEGTISFTMPDKTVGGNALSGEFGYTVWINGERIAQGEATAGAGVEIPETRREGKMKISVSVRNEEGCGPVARLNSYAGYDAPSDVPNLKSELSGNTVTLTWDKPRTSLNGGYLDQDNITYRITRYPGATLISSGYKKNEFSQRLSDKKYGLYRFMVSAQSHGNQSPGLYTDYVEAGPAFEAPWKQRFSDASDLDIFVTERGWRYDDYDGLLSEEENSALITPALAVTDSKVYKVTAEYYVPQPSEFDPNPAPPAPLAIKGGNVLKSSEMECAPIETGKVPDTTNGLSEWYIYPGVTGNWHLALIQTGAGSVNLESLSVEEGPSASAPGHVRNVTVTPDPTGLEKATVSFTVPEKTISGNPLSSVSEVSLYRDGEIVGKIENPVPGSVNSIEDPDAGT